MEGWDKAGRGEEPAVIYFLGTFFIERMGGRVSRGLFWIECELLSGGWGCMVFVFKIQNQL